MSHLRLLALGAAGALLACTVPSLRDLEKKHCDPAAGHPCTTGYECNEDGLCVVPEGGSCTSGVVRPCGNDVGECHKGQQTCVDGVWGECAGGRDPVDETCNGRDDDCDGDVDEDPIDGAWSYADADHDGHGDAQSKVRACSVPAGFVASSDDCDDTRDDVAPGATELCDGRDNDCDGTTDEGIDDALKTTFYADVDGDGAGDPDAPIRACVIRAGLSTGNGDCNDSDPGVHPGATEVCNQKDDDCNGAIDEGVLVTFFRDADGDGSGDLSSTVMACDPPPGYVADPSDCDDAAPDVHPGAVELCNGRDDNCNVAIDDVAEVPLVVTPNAKTGGLSWVAANGGVAAVYTDESLGGVPHVYFQQFSSTLAPVGSAVDLSDPAAIASTAPAIAALGSDVVIAWADVVPPGPNAGTHVRLARLSTQGTLAWTAPGVVTVASATASTSLTSPKVATDAAGTAIFVAWIDDGKARGAVYDVQGAATTPATLLSGSDLVAAISVARNEKSLAAPQFDLATADARSGSQEARFRRFDAALSVIAQQAQPVTGKTTGIALASDGTVGQGDAAAWIAEGTAGAVTIFATTAPFSSGAPVTVRAMGTGPVSGLVGAASTLGGASWAWADGATPQIRTGGSAVMPHDVTPATIGSIDPAFTWLGTGTHFAIGYAQDRGQSEDLYGVVLCAP